MTERKSSKRKKEIEEPTPAMESPAVDQEEYERGPGRITIAPDVLVAISRLAALDTPGVSRMSVVPGPVKRLRRGGGEGVDLEIDGEYVTANLYIVVRNGVNLREVSRNVQRNVTRAISEMLGMHVGRVNIHIEDIDFPAE